MTGVDRPEPPLELLEAWGQRGVLMDAPEEAERHRAAVVESMARIVAEERLRKARRKRWLWATSAVAAVAAAACAVYLVQPSPGEPARPPIAVREAPAAGHLQVTSGVVVSLRGANSREVVPGADHALSLLDSLRLGEGASGVLSLPRGVRVELAANTLTTLVASGESEQRLRLQRGTLTVTVPKPGGPHTFAIHTPDAEVVVHGTQFTTRVEEARDGSVRTFVNVTRGAVLVSRGETQALLRPGDSWASPAATPETAVRSRTEPAGASARERARAAGTHTAAERDALAEQNRLFQAALDARAAGDDAAVVRHLDRLLVRFPKTELAREARLTRFRALKRLGRDAEAAREAGRYLLDHPDGPSRGEARDLASH